MRQLGLVHLSKGLILLASLLFSYSGHGVALEASSLSPQLVVQVSDVVTGREPVVNTIR